MWDEHICSVHNFPEKNLEEENIWPSGSYDNYWKHLKQNKKPKLFFKPVKNLRFHLSVRYIDLVLPKLVLVFSNWQNGLLSVGSNKCIWRWLLSLWQSNDSCSLILYIVLCTFATLHLLQIGSYTLLSYWDRSNS